MRQDTEHEKSRSSSSATGRRWFAGIRRRRSREEQQALALPPISRGMQVFAALFIFSIGVIATAFVLTNPLDLPFLPGAASASGGAVVARAEPKQLYQCPMHPEVIEDHETSCPICGMKLVAMKPMSDADSGAETHEREVLYWYAPMDPTYIRDEPGLSPMGMKLVPKYADDAGGGEAGTIRIDPVQVQNIGVVSAEAKVESIARFSRTVGILDFNAKRITWINTKYEGWIETVYVNYVGQTVRQGQPLFEIYSPELVTTQEEYVRALEYRDSLKHSMRPDALRQAESLVQASRDRLTYWDITSDQIRELEASHRVQRRLTVSSPADGVVAEVMSEALEGMYVKPGMDLYKIADLSTVWVHADVYELDIPWIRDGQPAIVSFRNEPQNQFRGKVLFLYPEVSRDTRTLKICVEVPNPGLQLRPGMYADVVVQGPTIRNAVVVPQSAVIRSGERNIVFVDLGGGRFEPREVQLGVEGERDRLQILEGVAPGERVVTQAQFMLDSESRIQEAIAKFRTRGAGADEVKPPSGRAP